MSRKISIINYKGGTGKTCTVVNLAHALSRQGKKVLLIDTDPQGSATYHLGLSDIKKSLYDILVTNEPVKNCIVNARENIDVIGANSRLFPAEMAMAKVQNRERILENRLAQVSGYDVVLLDCAPSLNLLNQNALTYTREVLIPVSMEYLSLVGVKQLIENITILNHALGIELTITKVVPTFFDKRNLKSKTILESLNRTFPGKVSSPIRTNVAISEASGFQQTVFEYDAGSNGAQDYENLAKEVML